MREEKRQNGKKMNCALRSVDRVMQSDFSTAPEMTALAVDQASPFCHFDQRGEISERSDGQKVIDCAL